MCIYTFSSLLFFISMFVDPWLQYLTQSHSLLFFLPVICSASCQIDTETWTCIVPVNWNTKYTEISSIVSAAFKERCAETLYWQPQAKKLYSFFMGNCESIDPPFLFYMNSLLCHGSISFVLHNKLSDMWQFDGTW